MIAADLWATRISPDIHPVELMRGYLTGRDARPIASVSSVEHGTRIRVGGAVTHRQRPPSAGGITFLSLEDETGLLNVVVRATTWAKYAVVARDSAALLIRGIVETANSATNLVADHLEPLDLHDVVAQRSRDYR